MTESCKCFDLFNKRQVLQCSSPNPSIGHLESLEKYLTSLEKLTQSLPEKSLTHPAGKIALTLWPFWKSGLTPLEIQRGNHPQPHWNNIVTLLERQI
jgi:hypothetical protein